MKEEPKMPRRRARPSRTIHSTYSAEQRAQRQRQQHDAIRNLLSAVATIATTQRRNGGSNNATTAATAAPGQGERERCQVELEVAKENTQVAVPDRAVTQLQHLRHGQFAEAPVEQAGVTRRPAIHPAAVSPSDVHLHLRYSLPLLEVLLQQALETEITSEAVSVKTMLLSRPGKRRRVHGARPNI